MRVNIGSIVRMNYLACPYASPLRGFVQIAPGDLVAPTIKTLPAYRRIVYWLRLKNHKHFFIVMR